MKTDLLIKVERLKSILVSFSTGGGGDNNEYIDIREELIGMSVLQSLLPRFLISSRDLSEFWGFIESKYDNYRQRRLFITEQLDPLLTFLETAPIAPCDSAISTTIHKVDSVFIQEAWKKALERRASDSEGAITAARTLLETVCKYILDGRSISYGDCLELPKLYSLTAHQLNLSPSQHTEQVFKQILGSCQSVVYDAPRFCWTRKPGYKEPQGVFQ